MIGSENALNFDCCSKHHLSLLSSTAYQRLYSLIDIFLGMIILLNKNQWQDRGTKLLWIFLFWGDLKSVTKNVRLITWINELKISCRLNIPVWYIDKITIIDFTIYTQLFLVKLKSVVGGPILHSKSVVDGPFQYGILIKLPL